MSRRTGYPQEGDVVARKAHYWRIERGEGIYYELSLHEAPDGFGPDTEREGPPESFPVGSLVFCQAAPDGADYLLVPPTARFASLGSATGPARVVIEYAASELAAAYDAGVREIRWKLFAPYDGQPKVRLEGLIEMDAHGE